MIEKTIARRYAKALLDVSATGQRVRETQGEIEALAGLFRSAPEFKAALLSPAIPRARRVETAGRALGGRVGDDVVRFLQVLVASGRAKLLPDIAEAFDDLADAAEGLVEVHVRAPRPLAPDQAARLREAMVRLSGGRRIEIVMEADPSLIGGLVIRVGDTVIDGSVAGWLKRTRERLARALE
jgi:F-type H+-transporting ATPase subunit delta